MPTLSSSKEAINANVSVLVYDGLCAFEFACVTEIFGLARPELGAKWYRLQSFSVDGAAIAGQFDVQVKPSGGLRQITKAGTIIIPGWKSLDAPVPAALCSALQLAFARGARLLSICSGAVVLAAAGLLDGNRATTHWRYVERMQKMFPKVTFDADVLYVDNGQVLTSAGSAAGLDLCLHLVRRDFGAAIANHVARRLVVAPHREGGQAQFIERPIASRARDSFSPMLDEVRSRLSEPWPIAALARATNLSERSLVRRFNQSTGLAPGAWLIRERVFYARELLEHADTPIELVAQRSGFGTASTLRHHFQRQLGSSPSDYRRRFRSRG